jgi:glutamate--cysteine ligase catalytic subunit
LQIEYLVVNYKDDDAKVTLSLRQADILQSLSQDEELQKHGGCVPDLQDVSRGK